MEFDVSSFYCIKQFVLREQFFKIWYVDILMSGVGSKHNNDLSWG
jgi:hypothetical protein